MRLEFGVWRTRRPGGVIDATICAFVQIFSESGLPSGQGSDE